MLDFRLNFPHIRTTRSGSMSGSGRSTTASTTLKIAVVAPIPEESVSTAMDRIPMLEQHPKASAVLPQSIHHFPVGVVSIVLFTFSATRGSLCRPECWHKRSTDNVTELLEHFDGVCILRIQFKRLL
jgi:hypothetical protein